MGAYDAGIPLLLTHDGVGSRAAIEDHIAAVLRERTVPNPDTSAEKLARGITTSVLHRLGASYTVATGGLEADALVLGYSGHPRRDALGRALDLAMSRSECHNMPADLIAARAAMARVWVEIADRLPESKAETDDKEP